MSEEAFSPDVVDGEIEENVEAGMASCLDHSSFFVSESTQTLNDNDNSVRDVEAVSTELVLKEAHNNNLEAFQRHGVPRRLQFEDDLQTEISDHPTQLTLINTKQTDTIQSTCPRNTNTNLKIPKPSGIGLHLNSIVNAVQPGSGAIVHVKSAQRCSLSIRGMNSTVLNISHITGSSNNSLKITTTKDVSPSLFSTNTLQSSNTPIISEPVDDLSNPTNKRMHSEIETDGYSEEFKSAPQTKRKKSSDGCKRCNCRKSKCLKLYCDCFAAGIYCAGPCSCQGCFNRPEHVDKVLDTRQLIESRNPLAFAPKVVPMQQDIEPTARSYAEGEGLTTPSSGRHKRGCNCRKSMCLKKYCECYQANVGCSDGCGCEGCKNIYGVKGENCIDKDALNEEGANEKLLLPCNAYELTPPTPAIVFSNQRENEPNKWISSGHHFQSPESSLTSVTPYAMTPVSNPGLILETAGEYLDLLSSDQELYCGNAEGPIETSTVNHSGEQNPGGGQSFSMNNRYSLMNWGDSPNRPPIAQPNVSKPLKVIDLEDELPYNMQDDTPDILKDGSTPITGVKVSSPNKKRVSPPHGPQFGSSSLYGIRSGRKFILKSVPSCPPVTPSADSRRNNQE